MRRSFSHLEEIVDEKDLKVSLCPGCSGKLELRCFGSSTESHMLSCSKCRIVWRLSKYQSLYRVKSLGVKGSKNFF